MVRSGRLLTRDSTSARLNPVSGMTSIPGAVLLYQARRSVDWLPDRPAPTRPRSAMWRVSGSIRSAARMASSYPKSSTIPVVPAFGPNPGWIIVLQHAEDNRDRGPQPLAEFLRQDQRLGPHRADGVELLPAVLIADPLEELLLVIRAWRRCGPNKFDERRPPASGRSSGGRFRAPVGSRLRLDVNFRRAAAAGRASAGPDRPPTVPAGQPIAAAYAQGSVEASCRYS